VSHWLSGWRGALAVALVAVLAHMAGVHDGYVAYDTPWLVVDNPLLSPGSLKALPAVLWGMDTGTRLTLGAEYLPVRDLTVLLDFALFGEAWAGHHLQSLLWYALGCALFQRVAAKLLGDGPRSVAVAALFAAHPVHVESIAWLANRKDCVSLALFMATCLLWLTRGSGLVRPALCALLALLAFWAKNTAVVLPAVLVLLTVHQEGLRLRGSSILALALPSVAIALGLGITLGLGEMVGMYAAPRADDALGIAQIDVQVVARYLGMLAWPASLGPRYPEPGVVGWTTPEVLAAVALVGGLVAVGLAAWRRAPLVTLGLGWFFVALVPVMQLVPIQNLVADRYLLLPSAGLVLALGALLPTSGTASRPIAGVVVLALMGLCWQSAQQSLIWRSSQSLWGHSVSQYPELAQGWADLAGAQSDQGDHLTALATVDAGLLRHPDHPKLLQSRGYRLQALGRTDEAEASFRAALDAQPSLRGAAHNLALILIRSGRLDEAVARATETTQRNALYPLGWQGLGLAHMERGDLPEAAAAFSESHRLEPSAAAPICNLGAVGWLAKDLDAAELWWGRCLVIQPDNDQARRGLMAIEARRSR